MAATAGVNMLEQMASGLIEEKATKAKGLTPLVSERPPTVHVPDVPGDFLTHEGLAMIEQNLRRDAAQMLKIADGIREVLGGTPTIEGEGAGAVLTTAEKQKQKEREADARAAALQSEKPEIDLVEAMKEIIEGDDETFDARLARQTAEAQAATFKPDPADDAVVTPPGTEEPHANTVSGGGWQCPNGHDTIEEKVSPKGRKFARCTTCGAFQR